MRTRCDAHANSTVACSAGSRCSVQLFQATSSLCEQEVLGAAREVEGVRHSRVRMERDCLGLVHCSKSHRQSATA